MSANDLLLMCRQAQAWWQTPSPSRSTKRRSTRLLLWAGQLTLPSKPSCDWYMHRSLQPARALTNHLPCFLQEPALLPANMQFPAQSLGVGTLHHAHAGMHSAYPTYDCCWLPLLVANLLLKGSAIAAGHGSRKCRFPILSSSLVEMSRAFTPATALDGAPLVLTCCWHCAIGLHWHLQLDQTLTSVAPV